MTFFKSQYLLAATLVAPLFSFATEASAQTAKRFVVKGVVADATTKEGEQYANHENHIANRFYIHRRTRCI